MKYRIKAANGFAACIATHVVMCKGRIVFRGSLEDCHIWVQQEIAQ